MNINFPTKLGNRLLYMAELEAWLEWNITTDILIFHKNK